MRLFIDSERYDQVSIEIKRLNHIIGPNRSGKTSFLNVLRSCFEGKEKNCLLDGNKIGKEDFDVYYVGETEDLGAEKTLGTKSLLKKEIKNEFASQEDENDGLVKMVAELIEALNKQLSHIRVGDVSVKTDLDLLNIVMKNAVIVSGETELDNMSYTERRERYIDMQIDMATRYKKPSVLLIDEPFLGMAKASVAKMIRHIINTNEELIVFIASSNECFEGLSPIYVLGSDIRKDLLDDDMIFKIISLEQGCTFEDAKTFTDDEDIFFYKQKFIKKYQIESMFINCDDGIRTFDEFRADFLRRCSIIKTHRDMHH